MMFFFGRGEDGQLGTGYRSDRPLPVELAGFARGQRVRMIALGSGHSLVLTSDGVVWATGRGDDGRLGLGAPMEWVSAPQRVRLIEGSRAEPRALAVAAGSYHSAVIDEAGCLWMCGGSLFGKLGLGEGVGAPLPARVLDFGRGRVLAVTCGSKHTCALVLGAASANLSAYAWGSTKGVLGLPAAALPPKTSAAGAAAGGGAENAAQAEGQHRVIPFPTRIPAFDGGPPVEQLAACGAHTLALAGGSVWAWGEGRFGRCGSGTEDDVLEPRIVAPLSLGPNAAGAFGAGARVVHVAAGGFHSTAVDAAGVAWAWGGGEHGQLGVAAAPGNALAPVRIGALSQHFIVSSACGWSHSLFLCEDGAVHVCGNTDHGKAGLSVAELDAVAARNARISAAAVAEAALPLPATFLRSVVMPTRIRTLSGQRTTFICAYNEHSAVVRGENGDRGAESREAPAR